MPKWVLLPSTPQNISPEGRETEMQIFHHRAKSGVTKNSEDSRHSAWNLEYLDET